MSSDGFKQSMDAFDAACRLSGTERATYLEDAAAFQNCFGLSGAAVEPPCNRADWESNREIDAVDAHELAKRLTGPR